MKSNIALKTLSAIAHDGRLRLMRILIQAGDQGVSSGELARQAKIGATTASAQLLVLSNAGLVRSERDGRRVTYFADYHHLGSLMSFLLYDCCGGRPEICGLLEPHSTA